MEHIDLTINGMTCDHCVMTVAQALKAVDGVKAADVQLNTQNARIIYDPNQTTLEALRQAVRDAGYEVA